MKRKHFLYLGIMTLVLSTGCGKQSESGTNENKKAAESSVDEEDQNMEEALISREYLLEHSNIKEEDLEGVDVEAFIEEFDLKESNIDKVNLEFLLEVYKEEGGETSSPYAYLTEAEYTSGGLKETDIALVRTAALYITSGTYQETLILDSKEEKGYWGEEANLFYAWDEKSTQIVYTEEKREEFTKLLEECQVVSWKGVYEGTSENTTGSFGWSLYLELEDGKIYQYKGSGVTGEHSPKQWATFEAGVKKLFEG